MDGLIARSQDKSVKKTFYYAMRLSMLLAVTGLGATSAVEYGAKDDLLPGGAGLALKGQTLFTTTGGESFAKSKRFVAIDVTTPAAPRLISYVELKGFPQDLALAGNTAFVVDGLRLFAIDIANTASMQVIAEIAIAETPEYGPQGIVIDGSDAYLACRKQGVVRVDISKPSAPVVKTIVATPFSRDVALCKIKGKTALVSADDTYGLNVVQGDQIIASQALEKGSAARLQVDGGKIYVANGGAFLAVFTMDADGQLTPYAEFTTIPTGLYYGSYAYDVLVAGQYAVMAAGESGLVVVDLSNPAKPVCVSANKIAEAPLIRDSLRSGKILFVNGGTMNGKTLLFVKNVQEWGAIKRIAPPLNLSE